MERQQHSHVRLQLGVRAERNCWPSVRRRLVIFAQSDHERYLPGERAAICLVHNRRMTDPVNASGSI